MLKINVQALQLFYSEMIENIQKEESEKKDSWLQCGLKYLEFALSEEIEEYYVSGKKEKLVDVANMCMMLYNRKKEG